MLKNQDEIRGRIIQIRKERGLSQNQLAKDFGISRTHYCNVENGKKPVTESFLKVLASGYKIPMEAFIPNENGDLMQYCECTNDFVNAIIDDYFNSFEIRKYYIDEYEQPYYTVVEEYDAVKPYLKHIYITLYLAYTFEDYTLSPGNRLKYTVEGTLNMQRDLNTLIPDEDQQIQWD